MKKVILILILLGLVSGCNKAKASEDPNSILLGDSLVEFTIDDSWTQPCDIVFTGKSGSELMFKWKDGKFDVIYDPNGCTEAALVFIECMEPYLNCHIERKAGELK